MVLAAVGNTIIGDVDDEEAACDVGALRVVW